MIHRRLKFSKKTAVNGLLHSFFEELRDTVVDNHDGRITYAGVRGSSMGLDSKPNMVVGMGLSDLGVRSAGGPMVNIFSSSGMCNGDVNGSDRDRVEGNGIDCEREDTLR
jgi:hypothetical protein